MTGVYSLKEGSPTSVVNVFLLKTGCGWPSKKRIFSLDSTNSKYWSGI